MRIPVVRPLQPDWDRAKIIFRDLGEPSTLSNFGPLVRFLESRFAEILRVRPDQVVVFSSGTEAISAAVQTFSEPVNTVLLPDYSFIATLRAIGGLQYREQKIVDVHEADWWMNVDSAEWKEALFVPVAPFGDSPSRHFEHYSGKSAVFDCAASFGSEPDLSAIEVNHAYCFSLHATKVLGAGEGGFAVFGSEDWAAKARSWANFGRAGIAMLGDGRNAKMSEVQAAMYLANLEQWPRERQEWADSQAFARETSRTFGLKTNPSGFEHPHPYWIVELPSNLYREEFERFAKEHHIETRRWWPFSLAENAGLKSQPVASRLRENSLGLPMFRNFSSQERDRILEFLSDARDRLGGFGVHGS